jgi:predicted  nucleic acid-binding Zn-ribbon protein
MSDNERPDQRAFEDLNTLVRHLADELAAFRRRALVAEARLKELEAHEGGAANLALASRSAELETENERLREKLAAVTGRARKMLERVKYLRQQTQAGNR